MLIIYKINFFAVFGRCGHSMVAAYTIMDRLHAVFLHTICGSNSTYHSVLDFCCLVMLHYTIF